MIHLRLNLLVTASCKKKNYSIKILINLTRICCDSTNRKIDFTFTSDLGQKRWRSGDSTRLPPMWPGLKSLQQRHMWVEFDVGSILCSEVFICGNCGFSISLTLSLPESLIEFCKVTLTFESVDEIL